MSNVEMVCHNTDIIANMAEKFEKEGKVAGDDMNQSIMKLISTMESILEHQSLNILRCFYFNPIFNSDKSNITLIVNNLISPLKIEMSNDEISCNMHDLAIRNPRQNPTIESQIKLFTEYNRNLYNRLEKFEINKYNESYILNLVQRLPANSAEDHVTIHLQSPTQMPVQSTTASPAPIPIASPVASPAERPAPIPAAITTKNIKDLLLKPPDTETTNKLLDIIKKGLPQQKKLNLTETEKTKISNNLDHMFKRIDQKNALKRVLGIPTTSRGGSTRKKKKNN